MANIPIQPILRGGLTPIFSSVAGFGDVFTNTGRQIVALQNSDPASAKTVKFITQTTVDTLAVADLSVSVPPSSTMLVGRFDPGIYNNANGKIEIEAPDPWQLGLAVLEPLLTSTI